MRATEEETKAMIAEIDADGSGTIDFNEFLAMMARKLNSGQVEVEIVETFKVFDRNSDGFITAEELKHILSNLGEKLTDEELKDMIREADLDGDGRVSLEEFKKLVGHL